MVEIFKLGCYLWRSAILLATVGLAVVCPCLSQCVPFGGVDRVAVISYVGKRFHVQPDVISIVKVEPVASSCFLALHLHATRPERSLLLYLSPDHRRLMPDLYDMSIDPLLDDQKKRVGVLKMLAGANNAPQRGSPEAGITIVEFSDFQCPYCKQMAEVISALLKENSESQIKIVYKYFPLPMHDWATEAAKLAECTHKLAPDMFWGFHDFLFENQGNLNSDTIKERSVDFLSQAGVAAASAVGSCVDNPATQASIERDAQLGRKLGVDGTPTIFINGEKLEGVKSVVQIDEILKEIRVEDTRSGLGILSGHNGTGDE